MSKIYTLGSKGQVRIAGDPIDSENIRKRTVPRYDGGCTYARRLSQPYDHIGEDFPLFVDCTHPLFGKKNNGECLGQCATAGFPYGNGDDEKPATADAIYGGQRRPPQQRTRENGGDDA